MNEAPQLSTLGRYSTIASLGQGGMANIYLAVMSGPARFNKLLVIKALREDIDTSTEDLVSMFLDEARLAARLNHRNIVQTYEFGELDGRYYIAMEYLEGQPLRAIQRKLLPSGGLPLEHELRIVAETARGLHYAHELEGFDGEPLSVVHRDVSPHNVLVTYDGQVKLLDFGIAKTDNAEHLTKVGVIKGKIDYIAPEQVRGEKVDRRADVFSLGAMLWEAVSRQRFGGGPQVQEFTKIHRRLTGGEPKIRELEPNVPEAVACIIDDALALDKSARIATAADFADRIESYLATLANRPTGKSLAELMRAPFEADRQKLRRAIDLQIQNIEEHGRAITRASLLPRSQEFGLTSSGFVDLSAPGTRQSAAVVLPAPSQIAAESRGFLHARSGLLVSLAVAAVGIFAVTMSTSGTPSAVSSAPTTEAPGTALPPPLRQPSGEPALPVAPSASDGKIVRFTVQATPATARVTLDGAPLPSLPFRGDYQRSSALHHLEASAPGYQTTSQLVTLDRDREFEIVLEPISALARPRPRARPTGSVPEASAPSVEAAPGMPSDEVAPGSELKTKPSVNRFDLDDPYAE